MDPTVNLRMKELENGFFRSVLSVAFGASGAQAIGFLFAPLLTRLYGPEAFGVVGIVMASVGIVVPLFTLSLSTAIVLPKKEIEARNIAVLAVYSSLFLALTAVVIILVFNKLAPSVGERFFGTSPIYVSALGALSGLVLVATQFLIRSRLFNVMAGITLAHAVSSNGIKAVAGFFSQSGITLLNATVAGALVQFGILLYVTRKLFWGKSIWSVDRTTMIEVLSKYKDFPIFRMPQNILYGVSQGLPVVMLAFFAGPKEAGFFALARMVIGLPASLVTQSVSSVLYPQIAANSGDYSKLLRILLRVTGMLCVLGLLPFGLLALVGPTLFELVFGPEWYSAGVFAALLTPMMFFHFVNAPAVMAATALRLQHGILIYEVCTTTVKALALYIGLSILNNPILSIGLLSATGAIAYLCLILWVFIFVHRQERAIINDK
jgi:O-antigen/teichoic acid export membrane protein